MQQEFIQQALKIADIVIHPHLEGLPWTDFNRFEEFIRRGEESAQAKLVEIINLIQE